ncbi:hypothetical protein [Allomuricauda sp. d1]|uniref:hypothetical protein n=1 Tax=Allomuricauda sp. d1 TaxID=3136725 RepID=UPI0031D83746
MSGLRTFVRRNLETIERIRLAMVIIFAAMIVIDIVLAVFLKEKYPTFSEVVKENRTEWMWLSFLLGGLISKIFYNRKVLVRRKEISGFFAFVAICLLLATLGALLPKDLSTEIHLAVMLSGGLMAHLAWPQYIHDEAAQ